MMGFGRELQHRTRRGDALVAAPVILMEALEARGTLCFPSASMPLP